MNEGTYRGQFSRNDQIWLPGELHVRSDGELRLDVRDPSGEPSRVFGWTPEENVRFVGRLAESPSESGPIVTLLGALQTKTRWGSGGLEESWIAHAALVGEEPVLEGSRFRAVEFTAPDLDHFLEAPGLLSRLSEEPVIRNQVDSVVSFEAEGWGVSLEVRRNVSAKPAEIHVTQAPWVTVQFKQDELGIEEIRSEVLPVFETLLTLARRTHARPELVRFVSESGSFEFAAPTVAQRSCARVESRDFLFRARDVADWPHTLNLLRRLLQQRRAFASVFLANERAPAPFADDRLRAAVMALAHLTDSPPAPPSDALFSLPASVQAVPDLLSELLDSDLARVLRIPADFSRSIARAFRWATFQEGEKVPGIELVRLQALLKALISFRLLTLIGFSREAAEKLVGAQARRYLI